MDGYLQTSTTLDNGLALVVRAAGDFSQIGAASTVLNEWQDALTNVTAEGEAAKHVQDAIADLRVLQEALVDLPGEHAALGDARASAFVLSRSDSARYHLSLVDAVLNTERLPEESATPPSRTLRTARLVLERTGVPNQDGEIVARHGHLTVTRKSGDEVQVQHVTKLVFRLPPSQGVLARTVHLPGDWMSDLEKVAWNLMCERERVIELANDALSEFGAAFQVHDAFELQKQAHTWCITLFEAAKPVGQRVFQVRVGPVSDSNYDEVRTELRMALLRRRESPSDGAAVFEPELTFYPS